MKLRKSLVKVIIIWSIFFITSMSSAGLISMQDDNLNSFWTVAKLDMSFIADTYAESGGWESGWKKSWKKESWGKERRWSRTYNSVPVVQNIEPVIVEPVQIIEKKKVALNNTEKELIKNRFKKVEDFFDKKYTSNLKKLNVYKKLNTLLEEKILSLELIKINIEDQTLLEKYEKKILLFKELNILAQEKILVYIDSIDLSLENNNVVINNSVKEKAIQTKNTILENSTDKKAEDAKITEAKRLEKLRIEIEQWKAARAKRVAAQAEASRLAKIESDRLKAIAAEKARIAAQAAAQAAADANSSAS